MDGATIWLTGLSGSAKSTIARLAATALRGRGARVEVLDGDELRRELAGELGFSREDRDTNVRRIGYVADLLSRNGVLVLAPVVSRYRDAREDVRRQHGARFAEVHVAASADTCARRDVKGLYAAAGRGEIDALTGVSDPYEPPLHADLVLDTESEPAAASAARLVAFVDARAATRV